MVKRDAASLADFSAEGEEGKEYMNSEERISLLRFEDILSPSQTVVSTMLSDFKYVHHFRLFVLIKLNRYILKELFSS